MKLLLLIYGLICCITGIIIKKDEYKKKYSKLFIISGILLIPINFIFLLLGIKIGMTRSFIVVALVMLFVYIALKLKDILSTYYNKNE